MNLRTAFKFGIVVAVLVAGQYFLLPTWYRETSVSTSGWPIGLSVATGIALSVWLLGFAIEKLLAGKPIDIFGLAASAQFGSKLGAYIVAIASYPFALFLAIVVGGNFGGGLGGYISDAGIVIGIGLGIFIVATFVGVIAAIVGLVIGGSLERFARAKPL